MVVVVGAVVVVELVVVVETVVLGPPVIDVAGDNDEDVGGSEVGVVQATSEARATRTGRRRMPKTIRPVRP